MKSAKPGKSRISPARSTGGQKAIAGIISHISDKKVKDYAQLLDETGLRPKELLSVTAADIDFARQLLRISPEKTMEGIGRSIRLSKKATRLLMQNISPDESRIFPVLTMAKVQNEWKKASKKAGIDLRIHDLRRMWVTQMNKMDPRMVARMNNMGGRAIADYYLNPAQIQKPLAKPIDPFAVEKGHRIISADCGSGKTSFHEHLEKKGLLKKKKGKRKTGIE